jgi:hypothetical protein
VRGPRPKREDGPVLAPRRLPSGRWLNCRHLVRGEAVGFNPLKARQAKGPDFAYTAHWHDN